MHHRDFRRLDEATQAELRRQAFTNLDKGMRRQAVADLAEVHIKTIGDWIGRREELKAREYRGAKRGRAPDEQKLLSVKQEKTIREIIATKTPDSVGLPHALWTRKAISALVKKKYVIALTLRTVSKYTKRWGLTPQRPAKYAHEQNPEAIKVWLTETFPAIVAQAKKEGAEIHREDETGVSLATFYAKSYAPKGKTPAKRASLSMISSISHRGDLRFMLYNGALDTARFIDFLKRLVRDADKKIFLIVDNLSVHKAKQVRIWVEAHRDRIALFSPSSVRSAIQSR